MILSDKDILYNIKNKDLIISPLCVDDVQPASVDLHLNNDLMDVDGSLVCDDDFYILKPKEFVLGSTVEYVEIPNNLVGIVDGRSSVARLGVSVHETAGYIDPGFKGNITLEIFNASNKDFKLNVGDSICQLILEMLSSTVNRSYGDDGLGSKYQYSKGTIISRFK